MALNIKDRDTETIVRALADAKGQTITEVVREAAARELARLRGKASERIARDLRAIGDRLSTYPVEDRRSLEDMLYDENGLPK